MSVSERLAIKISDAAKRAATTYRKILNIALSEAD